MKDSTVEVTELRQVHVVSTFIISKILLFTINTVILHDGHYSKNYIKSILNDLNGDKIVVTFHLPIKQVGILENNFS